MKKYWVVIILGLLALNVQGQWYSRSFGVETINELSVAQLNYSLQRAEGNVKTGKILTYSGIGVFTVGLFVAGSAFNEFWEGIDKQDQNRLAAGGIMMFAGIGSAAVGIPLWMINSGRKKQVEIALLRFDSSALTGFRQPEQFGIGVKIRF